MTILALTFLTPGSPKTGRSYLRAHLSKIGWISCILRATSAELRSIVIKLSMRGTSAGVSTKTDP